MGRDKRRRQRIRFRKLSTINRFATGEREFDRFRRCRIMHSRLERFLRPAIADCVEPALSIRVMAGARRVLEARFQPVQQLGEHRVATVQLLQRNVLVGLVSLRHVSGAADDGLRAQ